MKQITKQETIVKNVVVYIAEDGREFEDQQECRKYESSAHGVLNVRYKPLVVKETTEYEIFDCGSEDYAIDIVKLTSQADVDVIVRMFCLWNSSYNEETLQNVSKKCQQALDENDLLFIGRGYNGDENFWVMEPRHYYSRKLETL